MLALVVGGVSGIGAAVVDAYRERGDEVVVWDIAEGADVRCDIAVDSAVDAALAATTSGRGLPDELTVCAGIGHSGLLADVAAEEWDRV
jgi:NAD(P)-dependent dehydrogenase (short-subunit alcohol dehydrogenase family)